LPAGILVTAGDRIGENRERYRAESRETGKRLLFLARGRPPLFLNSFKRADRGDDVAGLGLFTAGDLGC
jgi:hypothetical protein